MANKLAERGQSIDSTILRLEEGRLSTLARNPCRRCVFFYVEDRERTLDSPTDKIMLSLTAFADELEREKARQRTYDAMFRKVRAGQVTGGRVFGYDNVDVLDAEGRRRHVERRINEPEAAVVRRIFDLCAAGQGLRSIAKALNDDRVACAAGAPVRLGGDDDPRRSCTAIFTAASSSGTTRESATPGGSSAAAPHRHRRPMDRRRLRKGERGASAAG